MAAFLADSGQPSWLEKQTEGDVAQLGERRPCKAEVVGSSPIVSTSVEIFARTISLLTESSKKKIQTVDEPITGRYSTAPAENGPLRRLRATSSAV